MPGWDLAAFWWINQHHNRFLDAVLLPVSLLGEFGAVWIVAVLLMLACGNPETRRYAVFTGLMLLAVDRLVVAPVGHAFPRERPYLAYEGVRQLGFQWHTSSFPSGHANSVWVATVLLGARYRRWLPYLVAFALLTCYSRPYLGMHHPLDVMAGGLLGGGLAGLALAVRWAWQRRTQPPTQGLPDEAT
jgi:undecaprenyl-diphosphatase